MVASCIAYISVPQETVIRGSRKLCSGVEGEVAAVGFGEKDWRYRILATCFPLTSIPFSRCESIRYQPVCNPRPWRILSFGKNVSHWQACPSLGARVLDASLSLENSLGEAKNAIKVGEK